MLTVSIQSSLYVNENPTTHSIGVSNFLLPGYQHSLPEDEVIMDTNNYFFYILLLGMKDRVDNFESKKAKLISFLR